MSWGCLMHEQPLDYQTIYILHYVALAYVVAHWVLDALQVRDGRVCDHVLSIKRQPLQTDQRM